MGAHPTRAAALEERVEYYSGYRLEPGEIEDTMRAMDAVNDPEQQYDPTEDETEAVADLGSAIAGALDVEAGLRAVLVPEFWVVHDKHEGTAIWRWDGTRLVEVLHRAEAGPNFTNVDVGDRLWELMTQGIPTAPPCQFADGCKDVAITNPQYCPAHTEET